jgi:hypothetical protein
MRGFPKKSTQKVAFRATVGVPRSKAARFTLRSYSRRQIWFYANPDQEVDDVHQICGFPYQLQSIGTLERPVARFQYQRTPGKCEEFIGGLRSNTKELPQKETRSTNSPTGSSDRASYRAAGRVYPALSTWRSFTFPKIIAFQFRRGNPGARHSFKEGGL